MEQLILIDEAGNQLGVADKLEAHKNGGMLHLAFSILVYNSCNELLLQKRAERKYHFSGLWSNTCCGHPRPGEDIVQAARRRLNEEFGFSVPLQARFKFQYEAHDQCSGFTERELVHVLVGHYDGTPYPDKDEIGDWRWCSRDNIIKDVAGADIEYTPWFRLIVQKFDLL